MTLPQASDTNGQRKNDPCLVAMVTIHNTPSDTLAYITGQMPKVYTIDVFVKISM